MVLIMKRREVFLDKIYGSNLEFFSFQIVQNINYMIEVIIISLEEQM